ncbi:hypothetical protein BDZ85DRAFT_245998 [Elsinoe ampelina]|uniref:Uncharacterized protein n=1 Tax=Elsinoe ampelina TaxID=302913 RepID=A0A6A6GNV8_9PEZI|nr:hypothetical protein BDZ85DRAFT_245998 [Elsinoe ampelina]
MHTIILTLSSLLPLILAQTTTDLPSLTRSLRPSTTPTPLAPSSPARDGATTTFIGIYDEGDLTLSASVSTITSGTTRYYIPSCDPSATAQSCDLPGPQATLDASGDTYLYQGEIPLNAEDVLNYATPLIGYLECSVIKGQPGQRLQDVTSLADPDEQNMWESLASQKGAMATTTRTDGVLGAACTNYWVDGNGSTIVGPVTMVAPAFAAGTVVATAGVEKLPLSGGETTAAGNGTSSGGAVSTGGAASSGSSSSGSASGTGTAASGSQGAAGRMQVMGTTQGKAVMMLLSGLAGGVALLAIAL